MRATRTLVLAAALALAGSIVACEFSASTASIADAWMTTDPDGGGRTTTFAQDAVFYAQADLQNAPDGTQVKAVWMVVEAQDTEPNLVLAETEFETGSAVVTFDLTNDFLWPIGTYKVDIYLDGTLSNSLTFEVR